MENTQPAHLASMKCIILALLLFTSCEFSADNLQTNQNVKSETEQNIINSKGMTIATRFAPPNGFERERVSENSFTFYLRNLPLFPEGKKVALYSGNLKGNQNAQAAVIKMDVGSQDLQQCADAIMRLRAEYLYAQKKYDDLHFNFTNGFNAKYSNWRSGKGISINGNRVSWVNSSASNSSYKSFRKYLDKVFMYAGTVSLEKELKPKALKDIEAGNVFIKGGHPGHAVIVVDMATDDKSDKVFMLAQSYMPAQEIHVLKNPNNSSISPWYSLSEIDEIIETPEWTFEQNQLRAFD